MKQVFNVTPDSDDDSVSVTGDDHHIKHHYLLSWLSIVGPLVGIKVPKELMTG
ncbi:hypothetical protein SAMD00019534_027790 [Acytostelium subglobosum LB1]|uniref:hypothetical protein n=1 Tax=Acytostelium subglobosum LB1 TaxID=1410327 RepID=UPI000644C6A0|nr:hypothetical protein SAMD00019534_027790 [Acytostelium subglobosum LB1]GAM19604.1 hypothetical protein SAMD00019534_027790 [Acytostelium subglobosum LB1]|eukprot:XP_012756366.1 hypothetical protein SAMD00019534_027790 [Acytostelium subglobosum LB1]